MKNQMILVQGGSFDMGSNGGANDEKPMHRVTLSGFYIGKYEVTQEQYERVMGSNPSYFKDSGKNAPVEKVSWYSAVEFCNKLSEQEGLQKCYSGFGNNIKCDFSKNGYRLPTEAEWEYAARGGNQSKGYKYSGSDNHDKVSWYDDNAEDRTHPVGSNKPNELGIYDMSGNVWEWCWDWYGDYSSSAQTNPHGQGSGSSRLVRGGSWYYSARYCTVSYRAYATNAFSVIGFRLCRNYETSQKSLQEPKSEPEIDRIKSIKDYSKIDSETASTAEVIPFNIETKQLNNKIREFKKTMAELEETITEIEENIRTITLIITAIISVSAVIFLRYLLSS
jgi:formylglycine-generating enzyme